MLAPELVSCEYSEELMDLLFEYFKSISDVLREAKKRGALELKKIINLKLSKP